MAFKHQVSLSLKGNDILLVTLNHLDTIRALTEDSTTNKPQVDYVYELLMQVSLSTCFTQNRALSSSGHALKDSRQSDEY